MKKYLLLFTSAALLLVGCAKEQLSNGVAGELTNVTFTANLDNGVATKASADNDGAGTNVNRCIMEIYYGDTFYKRLVQPVNDKVATFANVPVVAGKQYTVLFWADCGGDNNADKYYKTNGPDSLKAVTVMEEAFITALQNKKNDELDAFFFAGNYTVKQGDASYNDIKLHRPFAQLNVITTDVAENKAVISEGLLPDKVKVSYTAYNTFNVADSTASGSTTYSYEADVYGDKTNWSAVQSHGELTLSMDYVLAAADKGAIDVEFKIKNGGNYVLTHNLTNLPYQRNYRTNVKGDLLTVGGTWTATIEPTWSNPDYDVPYYVASSITDAQNYISNQNTEQAKSVDLTKATITTGDIKGDDKKIEFILKTTSPVDLVNFTLPAIPQEVINAGCTGWKITYDEGYPTKNVGVFAPEGTKVKIDAPKSHVTVTGTSYAEIVASTGDNTLVIPQGVAVTSLQIKKGGLEIHGTVVAASVTGTVETVFVRECENLSQDVYDALKGFIDPRYCAIEKDTTPKTYDIVLNAVAEVNGVTYPTLAEAIAAANTGDVVKLVKNTDLTARVEISEKEISLSLNGKTIEYKGAQLNSGILLVHNGAGLTINGEGFIKSGTGAYAAIALTKSGDNANNPAKLTVNGGDIEGNYYGIVGNGSRHNTQIVINGGTITSTDNEATAIYHPQNGTLTINGGMIKGDNGLYIKSGTVANISGATIEATGVKGEYGYSGSGFNSTGDAIIVDNCNYPGGRPTVTIGDATLISANGFQVGAYFSAPETGISDIYKTGNTAFTVPEGYEWNEKGKLVKGAVVVNNQDEFVAACAAAVSGDKIVLGDGEFAIGPVDINGKTLTFKGQGAANTKIFIGNGGYDGNGGHGSNKTANMTFEDVTLDDLTSDAGYLTGFTEAAGLTFRNVTFNVGFSNWGNKGGDVSFFNCTFNQNTDGKYNVQELRSANNTHYLFDGCTFNSVPGRFINAYKQGGESAFIEIIVKNCSFTGTNQSKAAVNLKSGSNGCSINCYFLGKNTVNNVKVQQEATGSALFADEEGTYAKVYVGSSKETAVLIWENQTKTSNYIQPESYDPQS